ncbi:DeoR/GlpR family DNA-binding transcription regulator [Paenibacillus koleovorans]|uniref:DeoR/GlpR family DNA-binding transcription regulator n=1 Tax=Paenibacillus koleovorans TaxID=121608 RepID=UPI000FDCB68D|nr:DeoR/GlpR family DNA-binding transcription regulator [Paenibacillus koleovorans]
MRIDRQERLVKLLETNVMLRIHELCELLGASPATVRRDLSELEEKGVIKRINGGAMLNARSDFSPPPSHEEQDPFLLYKQAIARLAVSLVKEGDTIFIDAGTTNIEIAELLSGYSNISIITNSIEIAYLFKKYAMGRKISVYVCGGTIGEVTPEASIVGPLAEQMITQFRASIAFIGTSGIDLQHGVTDPHFLLASIKKRMIEFSSRVVLVADHSKFGKVNMAHVCNLSSLHHVITDSLTPASFVESMTTLGLKVWRAELE